jgi:hypothetical protein
MELAESMENAKLSNVGADVFLLLESGGERISLSSTRLFFNLLSHSDRDEREGSQDHVLIRNLRGNKLCLIQLNFSISFSGATLTTDSKHSMLCLTMSYFHIWKSCDLSNFLCDQEQISKSSISPHPSIACYFLQLTYE